MSPVARAVTSVPNSGTRAEPRRSATAYCISNNHPRPPRSEAPDLYSLFRTVLAHDGGATGASCSCGTHIEQRSGASLRGGQVDVAEMRLAACSPLEVLSGNEFACNNGLLATTVCLRRRLSCNRVFIRPRTLYSMFATFIEYRSRGVWSISSRPQFRRPKAENV